MTTGSTSKIERVAVGTFGDWNVKTTKTWTGGDSSPTYVKAPRNQGELVRIPARYTYDHLYSPPRRIEVSPATYGFRRRSSTPPVRPKSLEKREPHNYTVSGMHQHPDWWKVAHGSSNTSWLFAHEAVTDLPVSDWTSNDELILIGKLHSDIQGSDFNAGVALAEIGKTSTMIADSARRIFLSFKSLKKGNPGLAWDFLTKGTSREGVKPPRTKGRQDAGSLWLQMTYGWVPLVKDVYAGSQYLGYRLSAPDITRFTAVRYKNGSPKGYAFTPIQMGSAGPVTISALVAKIESKKIVAYLSRYDLVGLSGIADPAQILWELQPYSFVADWIIPVGSYLAALNTARSITGTFIVNHRIEHRVDGASCKIDAPAGAVFLRRPDLYKSYGYRFTRTVSSTLNVPLPCPKPAAKVASLSHAITSIALLQNVFGRR